MVIECRDLKSTDNASDNINYKEKQSKTKTRRNQHLIKYIRNIKMVELSRQTKIRCEISFTSSKPGMFISVYNIERKRVTERERETDSQTDTERDR